MSGPTPLPDFQWVRPQSYHGGQLIAGFGWHLKVGVKTKAHIWQSKAGWWASPVKDLEAGAKPQPDTSIEGPFPSEKEARNWCEEMFVRRPA
jgi:hypothetical protein